MPKDLHRAIQAARGLALQEAGIDVPYSAVVDGLVILGLTYLADGAAGVGASKKETKIREAAWKKRFGTEKDDPTALWFRGWTRLTEADYQDFSSKVGGLVDAMLPHLLKDTRSWFSEYTGYPVKGAHRKRSQKLKAVDSVTSNEATIQDVKEKKPG